VNHVGLAGGVGLVVSGWARGTVERVRGVQGEPYSGRNDAGLHKKVFGKICICMCVSLLASAQELEDKEQGMLLQ
jgi:hypothetical protein